MKPIQDNLTGSQNCSCTSCFYKSVSDHPSMRRITYDSKIDKLYIGKYLPLRECKLLGKLVRTRAVYDDVRNQLLSESIININKKADLKPKNKFAPTNKNLDDIEKSGAILELVDFVDKGAVLGPKTLSECCSCCFCSSNVILPKHATKGRRHRREQRHKHSCLCLAHGYKRGDVRESSNASDVSGHGIGMESRKIKNLKTVAKKFRSDPELSEMIKRRSKAMLIKLRGKRPDPMFDSEWSDTRQRRLHQREVKIKKTLRGIKQAHEIENAISKFSLLESLTKVNQSKAKLRSNLKTGAKKSLEKMKNAKIKMKGNLKTRIKESIHKIKPISDQIESSIENIFHIKKDSIALFREKLDKNRQLKNNKIKVARRHKHEKSSGDMSNMSDISVQARKIKVTVKAGTKKQKIMSRKMGHTKVTPDHRISTDITIKKRDVIPKITTIKPDKSTKPKDVGRLEKSTKPKKKRTMFCSCSTQKGNQEVTLPINENFKTSKLAKSMASLQSKTLKKSISSITSAIEKHDKKLKKTSHEFGSVESFTKFPAKINSANESISEQLSHKHESLNQAVKIGSSFSFNIEFSKEKPSSKTNVEESKNPFIKHNIQTIDKKQGQKRLTNYHNKYTDGSNKKLVKDTQAGLALKRCFCTLKLKPKKKTIKFTTSKLIGANMASESVTEAVQTIQQPTTTIKEQSSQHTCECNPIEFEKRIKKRHNRKLHTAWTNTDYSVKSTPSLTSKSISSASSKKNLVYSPNIPTKTVSSSSKITPKPASQPADNSLPHKQVVRISSSFSFNIEFCKDKPSNDPEEINELRHNAKANETPTKRRKNKSVDHARQHVKHKRSQMSSSTGKSKYTIAKHSLRRCFCTLKLAKPDKNRLRGKKLSKSTLTSSQNIRQINSVQPEAMSRSVATDKEMSRIRPKCKLLPYECEPGICEPGYCNPYECLEVIKRRNINCLRRRNIQANTYNRKIRSASSLTSRLVIPSKPKKIQSTMAYKSNVPLHNIKKNITTAKEVKTLPSSPNKQAGKIGSNFSSDIGFLKDKSLPTSNALDDNIQKRKRNKKKGGLQGNIKRRHKSTVMGKKERSLLIGPAVNSCLCKKDKRNVNSSDTGTETPIFKDKIYSKALKLKRTRRLEPFECEPSFCVPGECDPYECLERIKNRDVEPRDFGTSIDRSKMRTTSSITQKLGSRSKNRHVQINEKKNIALRRQKMQKVITPRHHSRKSSNILPSKISRQAVRISSSFSFEIQFKKDSSGIMDEDKIVSVNSFNKNLKKLKNRGENPFKVIQRVSQTETPRKQNRATDVGRMLKRCFCTFKLQNSQQKKRQNSQIFTHLKNPKVYAVNRIAFDENKLIKPLMTGKYDTNCKKIPPKNYCCKLIPRFITEPNSALKFNDSMQSYFYEKMKTTTLDQYFTQPAMKKTLSLKSNITSTTMYLKDDFNKQENVKNESQLLTEKYWKTAFNIFNSIKYQNSQIIDANSKTSNINGFSQYLKHRFCMMNVQVPGRGKPDKRKSTDSKPRASVNVRNKRHNLEPYECEPGFCIPYECDPIVCQKRIMSRGMKRSTTTITDRDKRSKSTSSYATSSTPNVKGKKIQSNRSRPTRDSRETRQGINYATVPIPRKQAVRLGSNFSFNIEFSKGSPKSSSRKTNKSKHPKKRLEDIDTKLKSRASESSEGSRHHRQSQSKVMKYQDKSSNVSLMLKRCFCTLKFQKKGKQQKELSKKVNQGTVTPTNTRQDIAKTNYVDAEQNTSSRRAHKLLPYECEPNICVPGECNPYECLELIKKRNFKSKQSGTDFGRSISTSPSMINKKKKNKGNNVQTQKKTKDSHHKDKKKHTKPSVICLCPPKVKEKRAPPPPPPPPPPRELIEQQNRQAVRIGSTFSFSIEFNKDKLTRRQKRGSDEDYGQVREVKTKRKTIDRGVTNKEISLHSRDSGIQTIKQKSQGSGVGPLLKRCFCTLKLHNQRKQENTEIPIKKAIPNVQTKSVMTVGNKRKLKYNLEPYECEPGVCIPGECDPHNCYKLIQKRNRKDASSSIRNQTKSTSSWAKSNDKHKTTNTHDTGNPNQRIHNDSVTKKTKQPKKSKHIDNKKHSKQAVKIESNFSFNIEFYKDKTNAIGDMNPQLSKKRHDTRERTNGSTQKNKSHRTNGSHNMGSQVFPEKMVSTMTAGGPFLKRCFCTLKLHKEGNKKEVANKNAPTEMQEKKLISPIERTNKGTYTNKTKAKHSTRNLEPYECEPGVCVPYECDPYECEKRIKRRLMRSQHSSTDKSKGHSVSILTSDSVTSSTNATQATYHPHEPKYHKTKKEDIKYQRKEIRASSASSNKDAVKIGSNFSFNVEFFKDRSPERTERANDMVNDTKYNFNEIAQKPKTTNSAAFRKGIHLNNRHSQVNGARNESKSSMTMLKRCFCTLKLQNGGNNQKQTFKNDTITSKYSPVYETRNVNVSTAIGRNKPPLEPCDACCESKVSMPEKTHPNISKTKRGTKNLNPTNYGRQSVNMGSNFNFNIEFFKNGPHIHDAKENESKKNRTIHDAKENESKKKRTKTRCQSSCCEDCRLNNKNMQSEPIKTESKGSGIGTLIKRCFCTLALQKKTGLAKNQERNISKQPEVSTQSKATSTKMSKVPKISRILDPNECEPLSCIPGECDPYECLKRIQKRNMKSRTTGTHPRKSSQISESNMTTQMRPHHKSKRMQAYLINKNDGINMVMEKPRSKRNRSAVKIGSNFSFNIEFHKETPPVNQLDSFDVKQTKKVPKERNPNSSSLKTNKCIKCCNTESQVEGVKTENKSSVIGNALKRCFCTAKLQKQPQTIYTNWQNSMNVNPMNPSVTQKSPFFRPVHCYFHYQCPNKNDFAKSKYLKSVEKVTNSKRKSFNQLDTCIKGQILPNCKKIHDTRNLETIFPYTPSKFKKSVLSKAAHPLKNRDVKNFLKQNKKTACDDNILINKPTASKTKNRRLTAKKGKKSITLKTKPLQEFIWRCKHIFSKQNKAMPRNVINISDIPKARKSMYDAGSPEELCICTRNIHADMLKISKSERSAKNLNTGPDPKKSISLKGAKVSKQIMLFRCSNECRSMGPEKRKFSIFQGGDGEQTHLNVSKNNFDKEHRKDSKKKNVQFAQISSTNMEHTHKRDHNLSQEKKSNRSSQNCHQCIGENNTNSFEDNINKGSRLSSFVPKCFCNFNNSTKGNSTQMKADQIERMKHENINIQSKNQTCQPCNKSKHKIKANNKTILSSGDGLAMPSLTRLNDPTKSRNKRDSVLIKSRHDTNIGKTQENLPVIKISKNSITYPESLFLPNTTGTEIYTKRQFEEKGDKRKAKLITQTCTCGMSIPPVNLPVIKISNNNMTYPESLFLPKTTGTEISTKRQFEKKGDKRKAKLITQTCPCGMSILPVNPPVIKISKNSITYPESLFLPKSAIGPKNLTGTEIYTKRQFEEKGDKRKANLVTKTCPCGMSTHNTDTNHNLSKKKNLVNEKKLAKPDKVKDTKQKLKPKLKSKEKKKKKKKKKPPKNVYKECQKEYNRYLKKYEKEDAITRKKRQKEQKYLDKQLKRFKKVHDSTLLAESVLDVSKFACNVTSDVLQCTGRAISDPKRAAAAFRTAVTCPQLACDHLKKTVIDAGAISTKRRLGCRCASLKIMKMFKKKLEENAVTNFLVHMTDKDPKKRFNPKKKPPRKKQKIPRTFGCDRYMASRRTRPFISVYLMSPRFYPYFLTMLSIFRQFLDMILFLLAVCVWSPCILASEICRAMTCCLFCIA